MTVQELIDRLSRIEDKILKVRFPYSHGHKRMDNLRWLTMCQNMIIVLYFGNNYPIRNIY